MSVIKLPLYFTGSKGEKHLLTLFDSVANLSCINPDYASQLGNEENFGRIRQIGTASKGHFIEVKHVISFCF